MSNKLDKSLDELLSNRRKNNPRRGTGFRRGAPAGGVRKNTRPTKAPAAPAAKPAQPVPSGGKKSAESKIMVSGLVSSHL